jgi:hypothetical protein
VQALLKVRLSIIVMCPGAFCNGFFVVIVFLITCVVPVWFIMGFGRRAVSEGSNNIALTNRASSSAGR